MKKIYLLIEFRTSKRESTIYYPKFIIYNYLKYARAQNTPQNDAQIHKHSRKEWDFDDQRFSPVLPENL